MTVLRRPLDAGETHSVWRAARRPADSPSADPRARSHASTPPPATPAPALASALRVRPRPGVRIARRGLIVAAPALPADPPSLQRSPAARAAATGPAKAQRIAEATGATHEVDAAGDPTVHFWPPQIADSVSGGGQPPLGGAADAPLASADAPLASADAPLASAEAPAHVARRANQDQSAIDELYDHLVERLRRDNLIERERAPGLALDAY